MTNANVVKRLLTQASVTVLAGLLMSSAMLAQDTATEGEDGAISVDAENEPLSIDPPALGVVDLAASGGEGVNPTDEPEVTECGFEFEPRVEDIVELAGLEGTLGAGADEGEGADEGADEASDEELRHPVDPVDSSFDFSSVEEPVTGEDPAAGGESEAVPAEILQNSVPSVTGLVDGVTDRAAQHEALGSDHSGDHGGDHGGNVQLLLLSN